MKGARATILAGKKAEVTALEWQPEPYNDLHQGVILVPPAPWEQLRLSWLYRRLAAELVKLGFHVLRFDLSGTGDSPLPTNAMHWHLWQEDLRAVCLHFRTQVRRMHLFGARLGGSLVWSEANETPLRSVHLLDPIVDLTVYQDQMQQIRRRFAEVSEQFGLAQADQDEILGFPIRALSDVPEQQFLAGESKAKAAWIYQSLDGGLGMQDLTQIKRHFAAYELISLNEHWDWGDPTKLQFQFFCHDLLANILQSFKEST